MRKQLQFITNLLKKIFFPANCVVCGQQDGQRFLCQKCAEELPVISDKSCQSCGGENDTILDSCQECMAMPKRNWDQGVSFYRYEGSICDLIKNYKYHADISLVKLFSVDVDSKIDVDDIDLITFIPLHPLKKLLRGYNQSELLAQQLANKLNLPCRKFLRRVKWTRQQAKLDKQHRAKNMKNSFQLITKNFKQLQHKHILLIDDVFTTGATFNEAAKILRKADVRSITILSIARG